MMCEFCERPVASEEVPDAGTGQCRRRCRTLLSKRMMSPQRSTIMVLGVFLLVLQGVQCQEFADSSTDRFNHLAVDRSTGSVYVGAVNALYQLDAELDKQKEVDTSVEQSDEDNWNKVLVIDSEHDQLVTCGSQLDGHCQTRKLDDISQSTVYDSSNASPVAADNAEDSTVAFLGAGPSDVTDAGVVLYTASTATSEFRVAGVSAVSSRNLLGARTMRIVFEDGLTGAGTYVKYRPSVGLSQPHNKIQYKAGFTIEGFSYFLTQQPSVFSSQPSGDATVVHVVSKMIQICHNDKYYRSYVEVPIGCEKDGVTFDLVKVAKTISPASTLNNGQPVVVVVFGSSTQPSKTALCVFKLADIRQAFTDSIKTCYEGSGTLASQFRAGSCRSGSSSDIDMIDSDYCGSPYTHSNSPLAGDVSLDIEASHVYDDTDITALALDAIGQDTVVFLGTSDGHVKKVILPREGQSAVSEFEDVTVHNNHHVQDIIMAPDAEHFYVMTDTKVVRQTIAECEGNTDCTTCTKAGNPYCGWCSLQNKCLVRAECTNYAQSDRYLTHDQDQCLELDRLSPDRASVEQEGTTVRLEILRLPPLEGSNAYKCLFSNVQVDGTVRGTTELRCKTPTKEALPVIPDDTDHLDVPLEVKSAETGEVFLETTFTFYDCSRHVLCSQCTQSEWKCRWCIYDNKCVDDDTACAESAIVDDQKDGECPRLQIPSEAILIPEGHSTTVTFPGQNIPDLLQKYGEYKCVFKKLQSSEVSVSARKSGDDIVCDAHEYNYDQDAPERYSEVRVQWHEGYYLEQKVDVTVYKCSVMGPDCSSCISLDRGDSEKYTCRWCDLTCAFKDSCTADIEETCPGPSIIEVEPLTAPIDGGTLITISGLNLGTHVDDVLNVTVAGQNCVLMRELYEISTRIVCKTEQVSGPVSGAVSVTVQGHATAGTFSQNFHYKDPRLLAVSPLLGPESGGTLLSITGQSLATGREQQIKIGDCVCEFDSNSLTDTGVTCTTKACGSGSNDIIMLFDGVERIYAELFEYTPDPTVTKIQPLVSFNSGGRTLTVTGTDLDSAQEPLMILTGQQLDKETTCTVKSATSMQCTTPKSGDNNTRRRRRAADDDIKYDISFQMDGVTVLPPAGSGVLQYVPDPKIYALNRTAGYTGTREHHHNQDTLLIEGERLNVASTSHEVIVTIGDEDCPVKTVDENNIYCTPPAEQPGDGNTAPTVTVQIGNLEVELGKLKYIYPEFKEKSTTWIIGVAVGGSILVIIIIIILIIYKRKSTEADRQYKKMQMQLDTLESNVRNECKQAFAELQTEVTDFTSDINVIGIPFWDYRTYTFKVLFPSHTDHPVLHNSSDYYTTKYGSYDQGLHQFNQLLNSKQFLLIFIRTLEQQRNFSIRDRAVVASLLMIVLQDKMEYATEIMKALLNELIDKSVERKHPKLMLRRTESVVEKLLTNWLSLSMYGYLKKQAGKSLFMLCRAIKHQTEKGPVDAISSEARYSLSEDRLLREKIQPNTLTVQLVTDDGRDPITCKVLDCDTVTQAKEKALDAIYLNTPHSKRPSVYDVDLEWRSGRSGHLPLQDEDVTTENLSGWKKCNTLLHYHVPDDAIMALVPKKNKNDLVRQVHGMVEITGLSGITPIITVEEGTKVWHLVKHDDNSNNINREKKVISEIFLTRLLATKGTLQQFIDDLFMTILKVDSTVPPAVKYLFDFLDLAARRHNIVDPDVVHTWKSNSLPLRFWVNIVKNPEFVFDIHKSHIVDSCLSVIAQTFMDSCSTSEHKLGKDSPSNKLLFAKDIPKYRGWVSRFYKGVQQMPAVSDAEITQVMTELSMTHNVDFNIAVALKELYKYATQYNFELLEALDDDPSAKKLHLANKFEQAVAVIEGQPLY